MMRMGSLFSGIGGLELGLEMAGLGPVVWQVEREPFCRAVLAKHWPTAERFDDVCTVGARNLAPVDLICGGFPCQDVSSAGTRQGLAGSRSGLWREYARIVAEFRPEWCVVENVAGGAAQWLDAVVGELDALGYDCLPCPVSARDVGAPHIRERIFVVAHAHGGRELQPQGSLSGERGRTDHGAEDAADVDGDSVRLQPGRCVEGRAEEARSGDACAPRIATDAESPGRQGASGQRLSVGKSAEGAWRESEPGVVRGVHGVHNWIHGADDGTVEERGAEASAARGEGLGLRTMRGDGCQAGAPSPRLPEAAGRESAVHKVSRTGGAGVWAASNSCSENVPRLWCELRGLHALSREDVRTGLLGESRGSERPEAMGRRTAERDDREDPCPVCGWPVGTRDSLSPLVVTKPGTPRFERIARRARIRALGNSVVPKQAEVAGWVVRELAEQLARVA